MTDIKYKVLNGVKLVELENVLNESALEGWMIYNVFPNSLQGSANRAEATCQNGFKEDSHFEITYNLILIMTPVDQREVWNEVVQMAHERIEKRRRLMSELGDSASCMKEAVSKATGEKLIKFGEEK